MIDLQNLELGRTRKLGRDGTKKLFACYIKDFICIALVPAIAAFVLPRAHAAMIGMLTMIILTGFYMYTRLSMRIRRLEERTECQRYV